MRGRANRSADEETERWKTKYLHSLDEIEDKERSWSEVEALLHRAIGRLAVTGYGLDPSLDHRLDKLREAVRRGRDNQTLDTLVREASDAATRLKDPVDAPGHNGGGEPLSLLIEHLTLPPDLSDPSRRLLKELRSAPPSRRPDLARELASLLRSALEPAVSSPPTPEPTEEMASPRRGLFGRLLGGQPGSRGSPAVQAADQAASEHEASAEVTRPAEVLGALLDRITSSDSSVARLRERARACETEHELERLVQDLSELYAAPGPSARETGNGPPEESLLNEVLLDLLQRMDLPAEMEGRVSRLRSELARELPAPRVALILDEIAELVHEVRRRIASEKQEIEAFLKAVTDRILLLDGDLRAAESARQESVESNRTLHRDVGSEMAQMRTEVAAASDLEQLKASINGGLEAVQAHVGRFIRREETLDQEARRRIEDLNGRLREMEAETNELRGRMRQAHEQAMRDGLTGLYNRLAFDERIEQAYRHWRRYQEPLSLTVVDIDYFKRVNDGFGHQAGDKALKTLAVRLRGQIRETDFVARYGGEELVIILPNTDAATALSVAEKFRLDIASAGFHYHDRPVPLTVSCGVSQLEPGDTPDTLFRRADAALYRAKEGGRNRCELAEPAADLS